MYRKRRLVTSSMPMQASPPQLGMSWWMTMSTHSPDLPRCCPWILSWRSLGVLPGTLSQVQQLVDAMPCNSHTDTVQPLGVWSYKAGGKMGEKPELSTAEGLRLLWNCMPKDRVNCSYSRLLFCVSNHEFYNHVLQSLLLTVCIKINEQRLPKLPDFLKQLMYESL